MGGILLLRDSGALTATSGISVNYASLNIDNTGLVASASRIPTAVSVSLTGGTLNYFASQRSAS